MNQIFYNSYHDFINSPCSDKSIFRGQSNLSEFWPLKSSYQRAFPNKRFSHWQPLGFNEIHFKKLIELYLKDSEATNSMSNLQAMEYLQHYGIQTPLIDFTRNRLKSLYFAGSEVKYSQVRATNEHVSKTPDKIIYELLTRMNTRQTLTPDELKKIFEFYDDYFISVVELRIDILKDHFEDISTNKNIFDQTWIDKNTSTTHIVDNNISHVVFTILEPPSIGTFKNLELQEGVFVYIDSESTLDELCDSIFAESSPIIYHLIPKPSLSFPDKDIDGIKSLYTFLNKQGITGKNLFDDLQGLKYDLNYLSGE